MQTSFYPAILYPADENGLFGVEVPGINVNASGPTAQAALAEAAAILQEVIDDLAAAGEPVPPPPDHEAVDCAGGTLALLPAILPGRRIRVNVSLPDSLVKRIDAVAPNRSAFLAESALRRLRES